MRFPTTYMTLGASLLLTCQASAQVIDCVCASTYSVGDRVVALVDDPSNANGIPAGTIGTVICGEDDATQSVTLEILVRWDGFTDGAPSNVDSCTCPPAPPGSGTPADWYVDCSEIELFTPVTNITQGTDHQTIADGVASANAGDELVLDAHTFIERGIVLNTLDITIRGQGIGQSIIDGDAVAGTIFEVRNGSNFTIEDVTIRNGVATTFGGGSAVWADKGSSAVVRRCRIAGHSSSGGAVLCVDAGTSMLVDRCVFSGNNPGGGGVTTAVEVLFGGQTTVLQSEFSNPGTSQSVAYAQDATLRMLNCTFAGGVGNFYYALAAGGSGVTELVGCVFDGAATAGSFLGFSGGVVTASRCLYPFATGDNIDGVPTFVDAAAGDYNLAPGSLGIDAADADAYLSAGGGPIDLAGEARSNNDPGVPDTGTGAFTFLDIGAYEFQGVSTPPDACPGDINGDGRTDLSDFNILGINFGCDSN